MLVWENYIQQCFGMDSSAQPTRFVRTIFDYGTRQRRVVGGYVAQGVRLVFTHAELLVFKQFWDDIDSGADIFLTSYVIHADETPSKRVRFVKGYGLQELGADSYIVTTTIEIVTGDEHIAVSCTLVPSDILTPSETLVPCAS